MSRVLMFEDLPEEIKREIFVRIRAVKYVVRSRCVCKSWNTLISSPCFVDAHHERNILMRSKTARDFEYLLVGNPQKKKRFSLFSAETYERCLDLELPTTHDVRSSFISVSGSCHGLLCISVLSELTGEAPIYLWNPSIRKLRRLPDSLIGRGMEFYTLFGFRPGENDYKVVKINKRVIGSSDVSGLVYQAEVYSLKLNSWRRNNSEVPLKRFFMGWQKQSVYFSGVVYSVVLDEIHPSSHCILAFDTCIEIFRKILLPNKLVVRRYASSDVLRIRVLEDALSLSHLNKKTFSTDIWVLEKDDTWNMHRTIPLPLLNYISWPLGFAANGGIHVIRRRACCIKKEREEYKSHLVLYDAKGCPVKEVETTGIGDLGDFVDAYTESLILIC